MFSHTYKRSSLSDLLCSEDQFLDKIRNCAASGSAEDSVDGQSFQSCMQRDRSLDSELSLSRTKLLLFSSVPLYFSSCALCLWHHIPLCTQVENSGYFLNMFYFYDPLCLCSTFFLEWPSVTFPAEQNSIHTVRTPAGETPPLATCFPSSRLPSVYSPQCSLVALFLGLVQLIKAGVAPPHYYIVSFLRVHFLLGFLHTTEPNTQQGLGTYVLKKILSEK